jgi:hypothetical protein
LKAGAPVNASTSDTRNTSLMFACKAGSKPLLDLLVSYGSLSTLLLSHSSLIVRLIFAGADVNTTRNNNNDTPLMFGAMSGLFSFLFLPSSPFVFQFSCLFSLPRAPRAFRQA